MLNKEGARELAYVVKIDEVKPIPGYDRVEHARVGGWWVICKLGQFKPGDYAIYFEVDSKVPQKEPFMFLEPKHFKIKTQKMCKTYSQGLLMAFDDFIVDEKEPIWVISIKARIKDGKDVEHEGLTEAIGVTYAVAEDNKRKAKTVDKYSKMAQRRPNIFKKPWARWMMKREWGRKVMFFFFGKKKDKSPTAFPTQFPYVKRTDQERAENMVWVLEDKTPYIKTQKCDGSSGTFILERKRGKNKFEFYVCSRNVRQLIPDQKSFYDDNYYWEVAIKYDIENKLKDYLTKHPELNYVCWQGEVCGPGIQKNPHHLSETHLFCFHMIDSQIGKYDIRTAKEIWDNYNMETVPIVCDDFIMPNDFEEFKLDADGKYDPSVCEGDKNCAREGFVYYKTTDPNFSFKNVSRKYLLKHE